MHRLSRFALLAAAALTVACPAYAQGGGLDARIREASGKLDKDSQSCTPIDLGEYTRLLHEAGQNKIRADKAAKKGIPVNQAQVDADLAAASALFSRAQAAMVQQCVRGAQQAAQRQATTGALPGGPGSSGDGTCPAPAREGAGQDARPLGPRIPSKDQIRNLGNDMVEAHEQGRSSEAEYLRGSIDDAAAELKKLIHDARQAGEMSNIDIPEAEKRLKELENLRKYADKIGVRPCAPLRPESRETTPKPADVPRQSAMNLSPFARDILAVHNAARAAVGAPPLQWDDRLVDGAAGAAAFAQTLAKTGQMHHSSREGRGKVRENISQGLSWWSTSQLLENWTKEKKNFKPGKFPDVSSTGNWYDVGHWAQMIWIRTVTVGCAKAIGGAASWLVCRYDPGGNRDGEEVGIPPRQPVEIAQPSLPNSEVFSKHASSNGDTKSSQVAENSTIRARPVGGDYGSENVTTQQAQPMSHYYDPVHDLRDTEAHTLFDLGFYFGADLESAYIFNFRSTEWSDAHEKLPMTDDDEFWAGSVGIIARLAEDTRLELGQGIDDHDGGWSSNGGIFWDPVTGVTVGAGALYVDLTTEEPEVETKVEQPALPNTEVYKVGAPPANPAYEEFNRKHWDRIMKLADGTPYEKALSGFSVGFAMFQQGRMSCNDGLKKAGEAQTQGAIEALKQIKAQMSEVGKFSGIDQEEIDSTIEDYEALMKLVNPKPQAASASNEGTIVQPKLPAKEAHNPADAPKCTLDVM